MNIDKLIHNSGTDYRITGFGSLMNIDKLIQHMAGIEPAMVLAL